jgi:hypothetical protein
MFNRERAGITAHDADDDAAALRVHARSNEDRYLCCAAARLTQRWPLKQLAHPLRREPFLHPSTTRSPPLGLHAQANGSANKWAQNSGCAPSYSTRGAPSLRRQPPIKSSSITARNTFVSSSNPSSSTRRRQGNKRGRASAFAATHNARATSLRMVCTRTIKSPSAQPRLIQRRTNIKYISIRARKPTKPNCVPSHSAMGAPP